MIVAETPAVERLRIGPAHAGPATIYVVRISHDAVGGTYRAGCDALPGLVAAAGSIDRLVHRVLTMAPELLALNGLPLEATMHFVVDAAETQRRFGRGPGAGPRPWRSSGGGNHERPNRRPGRVRENP